jgi:Holliday junction DNA helicase RuvA
LLTELKDKTGTMPASTGVTYRPIAAATPADDALSALVNLGYRRADAQQTVLRVLDRLGDRATLDALIRDSLKELAQRSAG